MDMELQEQTNWCWAAVAAAIHNFLNPGDVRTQGSVATDVLRGGGEIVAGVDCEATPGLCNYRAALDVALSATEDLRNNGFVPDHYLPFSYIKKWVNADLPIAARIVWASGGAHFVAVDGYREFTSGEQLVNVQDPASGPRLQAYEDLVLNYPPDGNWQDTYLVKKNGP
jgi:hypothetical protein